MFFLRSECSGWRFSFLPPPSHILCINYPVLAAAPRYTLYESSSLRSFSIYVVFLNPIQDGVGWGGGKRGPPTSFSPVISTNVGISLQNFLTFSLNPFDRLVLNFKFVSSASPKLLNIDQDCPSKKVFFLVKSL